MHEPVTATMDPRYSDANAVATEWEETQRVLETAELFWLSTVRADGRPHATPLVAVWLDGALHFCTGVTEQKTANLRGNPHVLLTTNCSWDGGLDVVLEGDAIQVTDDDRLKRLAQGWTSKWDGRWHYEVHAGFFHHDEDSENVIVYSVTPKTVYTYATGSMFSHTRYQFSRAA